jgi:hypothetical protein
LRWVLQNKASPEHQNMLETKLFKAKINLSETSKHETKLQLL